MSPQRWLAIAFIVLMEQLRAWLRWRPVKRELPQGRRFVDTVRREDGAGWEDV